MKWRFKEFNATQAHYVVPSTGDVDVNKSCDPQQKLTYDGRKQKRKKEKKMWTRRKHTALNTNTKCTNTHALEEMKKKVQWQGERERERE